MGSLNLTSTRNQYFRPLYPHPTHCSDVPRLIILFPTLKQKLVAILHRGINDEEVIVVLQLICLLVLRNMTLVLPFLNTHVMKIVITILPTIEEEGERIMITERD